MTVLDQYEIESSSTYESGSYDQVVMGKMFSSRKVGSELKYTIANRGVVYGSVNSNQSNNPGDGPYDSSTSLSYRMQPFREKAGNTRTAKYTCYDERYYDSMPPDFWSCTKRNGANLFVCLSSPGAPGQGHGTNGLQNSKKIGYLIFDNIVNVQGSFASRPKLNVGVDRHWTKSFPYEPKYNGISRQKKLNFFSDGAFATYQLNFDRDVELPPHTLVAKSINPLKLDGVFFGVVGPEKIGSHYYSSDYIPVGSNWKHYWVCDIFTYEDPNNYSVTSSAGSTDVAKILFGFGDVNTTFYSSSYGDSRLGTHNWPDFRVKFDTENVQSNTYEESTGSIWCTSPIIRGWKYGLYSGLPAYTSAYYRQGHFGQFRDMLEQRQYSKLFLNSGDEEESVSVPFIKGKKGNKSMTEAVVTVKFIDQNGNLTDPLNTQSSNLSYEATSSLPYFDLQFRNISPNLKITNLKLLNYNTLGSAIEI